MSDDFSEPPELSPPERIRRLASSMFNGTGYERWPDIEAEDQRVAGLNRSEWIAEAKHVPGETLMFMLRQIEQEDEQVFGALLQELSNRNLAIATRWAQGLNPMDTEEIAFKVDLQILELVLTDKMSRQLDFFEVAFTLAVERRTMDAVRKHQRSAMGRRGQIFFQLDDQSGLDSDEVERPLEFVADPGPGPGAIFLEIEDEALRPQFYQRACDAVKDPRHLEAVILFYGHGWPVESNNPDKPDLAHYFNVKPWQVRYWIEKALAAMREAQARAEREREGAKPQVTGAAVRIGVQK